MKKNPSLYIIATLLLIVVLPLTAHSAGATDPAACTVKVHISATDDGEKTVSNPDKDKCVTGDVEKHAPTGVGQFCPTTGGANSDAWCFTSVTKDGKKFCTGNPIPMNPDGSGLAAAIGSRIVTASVIDENGKYINQADSYAYSVNDSSKADNIGSNDFTVIFPTKLAIAGEAKPDGLKTVVKKFKLGQKLHNIGALVIGQEAADKAGVEIKKSSNKSINNCADFINASKPPKTASNATTGGYYNPQSIEIRYSGWALAADQSIIKIGQNSYFTTKANDFVSLNDVGTILNNYAVTQLNLNFCSPKSSAPLYSTLNPDHFCVAMSATAGQ